MTDVALHEDAEIASVTLFGTDNPAEVVARASVVATTLADLVRRQNLIVRIGQSDHVRVEGWTLLGSMLGVFPVVEWTRPVLLDEKPAGWEARVEARTRSGEVVGAAEAECLRTEKTWSSRDDYALRSMAQTRAVSKALRLPLGFVMQLAGFNPTPAEEMPVIEQRPVRPPVDSAAGTPFADLDDAVPGASVAQKKKLNVLVGQLRAADHITTESLWKAMRPEDEGNWPRDIDGVLHWSDLRDTLTKDEASGLIERLSRLEARVVTRLLVAIAGVSVAALLAAYWAAYGCAKGAV